MGSQTDQALKVARRFVRAVQRSGIELDAAYLYGSYANGTAHADSDIDVALVSKDMTGGIEDLEKISAVTRTQDSRIECVRFHPRNFQDEHPLVWEIKNKGIPLTHTTRSEKQVHTLDARHVVTYWRKTARQEWRQVQAFFASKHYSYALVFARRYLENVLKALVVQRTGTHAPYHRSLSELAIMAQVDLNETQQELLERVDSYTDDKFEHPDAVEIRRSHTRRFTASELKRIQHLGKLLLSIRLTSKRSIPI